MSSSIRFSTVLRFWIACAALVVALFGATVFADPITDANALGRSSGCAAALWGARGYADSHALNAREYYAALGRARASGRCEDADMAAVRRAMCSRGNDRMVGSLCAPNPADEPVPPLVTVPSVPAPAVSSAPVPQPAPQPTTVVVQQQRQDSSSSSATTTVVAPPPPPAPPAPPSAAPTVTTTVRVPPPAAPRAAGTPARPS